MSGLTGFTHIYHVGLTVASRGVEFLMPPTERPWGIEAVFRDNSGNWFSMVQPSS